MAFEDWWESAPMSDSKMGLAWEAWHEATAQERERLVQFVMGLRTSGCDIDGEPAVSRRVDVFEIAAAIREGQNAISRVVGNRNENVADA